MVWLGSGDRVRLGWWIDLTGGGKCAPNTCTGHRVGDRRVEMLRIIPNGGQRRDALRMIEYGGDPWETVIRSFVWRSWAVYDDAPTADQWREIGRVNGRVAR